LSSGGDSELCLVILFLGYELYYDERLRFTHFIPKERLSWSYCVKMLAGAHGIPQVYFSFYKILYRKAVNKEAIDFYGRLPHYAAAVSSFFCAQFPG